MGFFSSIGNFISGAVDKVVDVGKDLVGGIVSDPLGAIGTVGNVVGGLMGNSNQASANSANAAMANAQYQFQKDYIRNRLQWGVEDAKKAGLHPMVAAGLSPASFSPVTMQQSPINTDWIGETGQSLAYASAKAKDRKQQQEAWNFTRELNQEQLNGVRLDNELKTMQILSELSRLNQTGPSAPTLTPEKQHVPGQSDSGYSSILGKNPYRLFNIAMHGDSALLVLNPDIADSITESSINNLIAMGVREVETGTNHSLIDEIISHFPKHIQREIADGNMRLASIPGTGAFRAVPLQPGEKFDRYNVYGVEVKK